MLTRRGIITGLISFAVAPAIVKYANIMPVKVYETPQEIYYRLIPNIKPIRVPTDWSKIWYDELGRCIFTETIDPKDIYIDHPRPISR